MTTIYLLLILGLLVISLILVIKFRPALFKRYWKYGLGILAGVFSLVFVFGKLVKRDNPDKKGDKKRDKLDDNLEKVNKESAQEIAKAVEKEDKVREEVARIKEIPEEEERLKQLADLFNKTRR